MSWIKDNKFIVALGGGTFLGAVLLLFLGLRGSNSYEEAREKFASAAEEASGYEKLPLYPKTENRDGKTKSITEYRKSVEALQEAFKPFRPKEIKNITPQEFTTHLLAANSEVREAFEEAGTTVPEAFFVGFEGYKTSLASSKTTGILDYQLGAIKNLMLSLAKTKPTALINLFRPPLLEEQNQNFKPSGNTVARQFPVEITFSGPESSAREFLSSIVGSKDQYFVARSIRIINEKKDPPRAADAKFDKPVESKPAAESNPFGGGFVLPGDEPAQEEAAEEEAPAIKTVDTSRILSQVLGNEEVQVFVRLDLLEFLPAKKLP